jgi:hypothetical protein
LYIFVLRFRAIGTVAPTVGSRRLKLLIFVPLLLLSMARQRVKVRSFCLLGALVPAVMPTSVDLVLAAFKEEVVDSCSMLFMRLDGGLGLLILTAAVIRPAWRCQGRCGFWGAPASFVLFPYFCERERLCDGIPDGGGWWVTGSSVLQLAAPDLCSISALRNVAANGHSSSKVCLGVASSCRFLRL